MPVPDLLPGSKEIKDQVLKSFDRTPESLKADVDSIREWAKKQPHFPEIPADPYIEGALIMAKFEFARAKSMLDMYYTFRGIAPEFHGDPETPEVLKIFDLIYWIPMPKVTSTNSRIIITKIRQRSKDQQFDGEAYLSFVVNMFSILLYEDPASTKIICIDGSNVQMEHISSFSPFMLKKIIYSFEKMQANQVNQIHLYNMPSIMEPLLALSKSILKAKIAEKIFVHKNYESLYESISKANLPQDYGGEAQSLESLNGLWRLKYKEFVPRLRQQNLLRTDESKRPEEAALDSDFLGLEGNFRKLNVD